MDWLLILVLFGVAFYQRGELRLLKQQIEGLEGSLDHVLHLLRTGRTAEPLPDEQPVPPVEREAAAPAAAKTVSVPSSVKLASAPPAPEEVEEVPSEDLDAPDLDEPGSGPRFALDFEDVFGRKASIWAGGVTLAVTGVLAVRYSIEQGLLTQVVRVALSFLFGIGLLGAAEAAYRNADRVGDERVCQALAGAGLATLYAGFYLAGTQYALIGQTIAFLGLAGVTALAIALSYRFGLPSAVLGLVGGFAAPALVGSDEANLPLLALYLALVTGGLTQTGNRQRRPWLGLAALIGGLGWGGLLLTGSGFSALDIVALGLFFVLLGAILPAVMTTTRLEQPLRLASAAIASLQLAVLVNEGGYSPLTWGLYLLLAGTLAWFGWRREDIRPGSAIAAAIGILLLGFWPSPDLVSFGLVLTALAAVFAGIPLLHLSRGTDHIVDRVMVAAVPSLLGLTTAASLWHLESPGLFQGLASAVLAIIPAAASKLLWQRGEPETLAVNLASASFLLALTADKLLPEWSMPIATGIIGIALVYLLRHRLSENTALASVGWLFAVVPVVLLPGTDAGSSELMAIFRGMDAPDYLALLRWLVAGAPLAALAFFVKNRLPRSVAEFLAAIVLFCALAQVLPPIANAWLAGVMALGLRWKHSEREGAVLAFVLTTAMWALPPLGTWAEGGIGALSGDPFMLGDLPGLRETFGFILPFGLALAAARVATTRFTEITIPAYWAALPVGFIALHVLFKQIFAIETVTAFEQTGLAERTLFEALMLALAWGAATGMGRWKANTLLASILAALSLAHFAWFTGFWHNPLFAMQAVGQVPVANLALATFALAIGTLLSLRLWQPRLRRYIDAAVMALATLGAITLLRQIFAGSYLPDDPMSQAEDLLRSLVAIVLAIVFLLIGSRRGERTWRVGSLVLMTGAAIKVFGFDTAGLEGLVQIASFLALGASLIGIGWFYSRQLRTVPDEQ